MNKTTLAVYSACACLVLGGGALALLHSQQQAKRIQELNVQVATLDQRLKVESTTNRSYSDEAAQLQQSAKILERELNRLKTKVGLSPSAIFEPQKKTP